MNNAPMNNVPMNDAPRPPHDALDDAFDRALRMHYRQATTQLSSRTRAQLQQRTRAATSPRPNPDRSRRMAWSMAVACSLALLFGVGQRLRAPGDRMQATPASIAAATSDGGELVATLDETPDLYLWVASDDAAAMTSE